MRPVVEGRCFSPDWLAGVLRPRKTIAAARCAGARAGRPALNEARPVSDPRVLHRRSDPEQETRP
jgi:hypothetical protein